MIRFNLSNMHRPASLLLLVGTALASSPAWASGSSMPWETPLNSILDRSRGRWPRSSRSWSSS
jgi:type IV secretion system protein VirB2